MKITKSLQTMVLGVAFTVMTGCAEVPQMDMDAAKMAMDSARNVDAETYAPDQFRMASETMTGANTEVETQNGKFALMRNYDQAKTLLQKATTEANAAQTAAIEGKQAVQAEVQELMVRAQTSLDETKGLLAQAPKGKETKEALEAIQNDLMTVESAIGEANTLVTSEEFMTARDRLNSAIEKTMQVNQELTEAIAKKKGGRR